MKWDDLQVLLAASRTKSLGELSLAMGMDATTASRRLKALEVELQIPLLSRVKGRMVLTPQARQLVAHLEGMEKAEFDFRALARLLHTAPETIVRVSAPPTLARYVLAAGISVLHSRNPSLSLELDVEPANIHLERWEADIAVRLGRPTQADPTLLARKIGRMGYSVFRPIDHRETQRWIAYPKRFSHVPEAQWVERKLAGADPSLRSNDPTAMGQAVAQGVGLALLPELLGGTIDGIETIGPSVLHREIWLLRRADMGPVSAVQAVCNWLAEQTDAAGLR